MNSKLEELKELYNLSKNKYLYDNIELLENEDIRKLRNYIKTNSC